MQDTLGGRFKAIEAKWKAVIPAKGFMVVRVDGRAFHTWTRGLCKPFDPTFNSVMNGTAVALCQNISGALCAYVQSDEISVITTDLIHENTEAWFGGVVQKVVSVSAAIATQVFNAAAEEGFVKFPVRPAHFDARVFPLETVGDVADYLRWRQTDCRRNAISMLAHHYIGKNVIMGLGTRERAGLLTAQGFDPESVDRGFLNGRLIHSVQERGPVTFTHKRTQEEQTIEVERFVWKAAPAEFLRNWFYDNHIERFGN